MMPAPEEGERRVEGLLVSARERLDAVLVEVLGPGCLLTLILALEAVDGFDRELRLLALGRCLAAQALALDAPGR